jgi:hypothetical protein
LDSDKDAKEARAFLTGQPFNYGSNALAYYFSVSKMTPVVNLIKKFLYH